MSTRRRWQGQGGIDGRVIEQGVVTMNHDNAFERRRTLSNGRGSRGNVVWRQTTRHVSFIRVGKVRHDTVVVGITKDGLRHKEGRTTRFRVRCHGLVGATRRRRTAVAGRVGCIRRSARCNGFGPARTRRRGFATSLVVLAPRFLFSPQQFTNGNRLLLVPGWRLLLFLVAREACRRPTVRLKRNRIHVNRKLFGETREGQESEARVLEVECILR